jgi:hypothetical protein
VTHSTHPVSVVIATLGGDSLAGTLQCLNRGSSVPAEILICIPVAEAPRVAGLAGGNVRVLATSCRGQVAQRAEGFRQCTQNLVLQMDDDIVLEHEHLHAMIESLLQLGPGNVVAPIYRDLTTRRCLHTYAQGGIGRVQNFYAWLLCGARWGVRRMGTVAPAGVSYGVDEVLCTQDKVQTEWVPGGCTLGFREDLITDNFFPFPGKAYCEDLIHSRLRRERGTRLWVLSRVYCMTPAAPPQQFTWASMRADLRVRRHVVRIFGGSTWRLALWFIADVLRRAAASVASFLPLPRNKGSR